MTKVKRGASIPLIVNDPYFSIWSPADHLTDCDTQSWTGKEQPVRGYIRVGESTYRFMGADDIIPAIAQKDLDVSATQTKYTFENEDVHLELLFSVDLDLQDLKKISEPVTMITVKADVKNDSEAAITFAFSEEICRDQTSEDLHWRTITTTTEKMVWMGKGRQTPLNSSGDLVDIDWGYLYLAAKNNLPITYQKKRDMLLADFSIHSGEAATILVAYDDMHAINYFGNVTNALWKESYTGMYDLLQNYLADLPLRLESCKQIDKKIQHESSTAGGDTLDFITAFSYRQSICAHKLIRDSEGEIVFLSKECSSNGCIGTVDISYPSIPLYLLYQTELAKGMLRPVYKFADMPVWEFDFAPHDVGRYPYVTGQVYGEITNSGSKDWSDRGPYDTIYDYYQLPKGQNVYRFEQQMPIEECGNMLAMISAIYLRDKDDKFFTQYLATNLKWADYLATFGQDPENQLCTDDFAGHLAHNCNLSLKAVTALGMFGAALKSAGYEEGVLYSKRAKEMAKIWQESAIANGEHTPLAFDQPNSWSIKYNIVWDNLFDLGLFPAELMEKEITKYLAEANEYGIPLDQRANYTKADWIMWISIFAKNEKERERIIQPVRHYLENTSNRVPFSDWYDTKDARVMNFKNRTVVGAMFMPLLKQTLVSNLVNV
ncbi:MULTISPECIES: glutaminase domain-containing protein [Enterococcus]|jgi:hypothetical protein|uniref:glutaminase domain-containing protein n=1 Tax=Enterococcus TaxID=1350 RepID=UPI00189EE413|nr:DUF4965 domain-containing protein [Enterococcus dispar]MCU7358033.1 DUF4965 domain-containing protein [Enterococcus dispar]WCG32771.1 DUF4965 domain-containing protein [Enterococcus dispar]